MASTRIPVTQLVSSIAVDGDLIDSWDEYNLAIAATVSRKSKDPRCRVGAVIVRDHLVLSTGFNGLARDVHDDPELLNNVSEKLKVICHAEQNAIYNAARLGIGLHGATIYVTKFPCLKCCNAVIQAGITRIYTHDEKFWDDDPDDENHSRKKSLLRQSGIKVEAPYHHDYRVKRVMVTKTTPANDQSIDEVRSSKKGPNKSTAHRPSSKAAKAKRRVGKRESEPLPLPPVWVAREPTGGEPSK